MTVSPQTACAAAVSERKGGKTTPRPDLISDEESPAAPLANSAPVLNGGPRGTRAWEMSEPSSTWRYGAAWLPLAVTLIRFAPSGVQQDVQELGWAGPGHHLAWGSTRRYDGQLSSTDYGLIYLPAFNTTVLALEWSGRWGAAHGVYLAHGVQAALYQQPAVAAENGRAVIQTAADANVGYWAGLGLRGNIAGLGWYGEAGWLLQSAFTPVLTPVQGTRVNVVYAHSAPTARVGALLLF